MLVVKGVLPILVRNRSRSAIVIKRCSTLTLIILNIIVIHKIFIVLLVIEMVMPQGNDPSPARGFDLLMLLANEDGGVRTETEFRDLFTAAGLQLTRVIPTASPNFILEGVRA